MIEIYSISNARVKKKLASYELMFNTLVEHANWLAR